MSRRKSRMISLQGIHMQTMMIAIIPIMLMLILLEGYSLSRRFADLDHSLQERAEVMVKQLATTSEYAVFSGNKELLHRYVDATLGQPDVERVVFWGADGRLLVDSSVAPGQVRRFPAQLDEDHPSYAEGEQIWLYQPILPTEVDLGWPEEGSEFSRSPVKLGGVVVEISKRRLSQTKIRILLTGLLISLGVGLVSLAIAFRTARRITRPIEELNNVIDQLGRGNLDQRMMPSGVDELDELGLGVNVMAQQLQEERNGLQVRIKDATDEIRVKKEQAEKISQEKSRFLAAAGHDLRQPLAAANLFIDALRMSGPTGKQVGMIQRLEEAMSTFNGMLDALLDISKLDAGVIRPDIERISVVGVFEWLERSCGPMAVEKGLACRFHFPLREDLVVLGDIGLLQSVMINLVTNAIKYTASGAVLVSARRRGGQVLFQVWDTGIGIPFDNLPRVFDEFYQVGNAQRDRSKGLGLGLSIARRAMRVMGGDISCSSRPGRGSVFGFSLPRADEEEAGLPLVNGKRSAEALPDLGFVRGKRFLLTEDDVLVAQALTALLAGAGAEVVSFETPEELLAYPGLATGDYFITDYMLGDTQNGIELLEHVQQLLGRTIRAVVLTGNTSPDFMARLADCPWTVLHKPVKLTELVRALKG